MGSKKKFVFTLSLIDLKLCSEGISGENIFNLPTIFVLRKIKSTLDVLVK